MVALLRVLIALVMAGIQAGRISTFLPNYSKAILSARRIFKLLDTVPEIDNYSTEGLEPVSELIASTIKQQLLFKNFYICINLFATL